MTRWRAIAIGSLFAAAAALAVVVWLWRSRTAERPLERGWSAVVASIAGDGVSGVRDGDAAQARFSDPFGVAIAADGTIYIADAGRAQRIRRVSPAGTVTTFAGSDTGFSDGIGSAARFDTPSGLAVDQSGTLYLADTGNNAIRRITSDGVVSTLAGDGVAGYRDGPGPQARFNGPIGIAVDPSGRVIVADTYNDRIRAIAPDGSVTTLAGGAQQGATDGAAADARFNTPCGAAVDPGGTVYVADTGNGVVRAISPAGEVSTIAFESVNRLAHPTGIAVSATREIYVGDDRGRIAERAPDGAVRILAGSRPGFADGPGPDARFRRLASITFVAPGRLIAADAGNALVRLIAARSRIEFRPPPPPLISPHFDAQAFAWEPLLWPLDPMEGPHEIAGTLGEARGGEGGERFHAGIDIRADEDTPVRAVRDGVVAAPAAVADFETLNESLRIGPLAYVHLRVGRHSLAGAFDDGRFVPAFDDTGTIVGMRVKRGARFSTGEVIGTINAFNHVHLNVGWSGEERNPLLFRLVQFEDTVPPTIRRGGVHLYDEAGAPLKQRVKSRLLVQGRVHIIVDAWDQVNGNAPRRRLGLYQLGYQVLTTRGSPVPGFESARTTIVFDQLAASPDAARLVYAAGSGIPFYGRRTTRFLYDVTNTFRHGVARAGVWDTTMLPAGNYILRVLAADVSGNEAIANRDVPITIVAATDR